MLCDHRNNNYYAQQFRMLSQSIDFAEDTLSATYLLFADNKSDLSTVLSMIEFDSGAYCPHIQLCFKSDIFASQQHLPALNTTKSIDSEYTPIKMAIPKISISYLSTVMVATTSQHFAGQQHPTDRHRSDVRSLARNMTARADVRNARACNTFREPPSPTAFRIVLRVQVFVCVRSGRSRSPIQRHVYTYSIGAEPLIHSYTGTARRAISTL